MMRTNPLPSPPGPSPPRAAAAAPLAGGGSRLVAPKADELHLQAAAAWDVAATPERGDVSHSALKHGVGLGLFMSFDVGLLKVHI